MGPSRNSGPVLQKKRTSLSSPLEEKNRQKKKKRFFGVLFLEGERGSFRPDKEGGNGSVKENLLLRERKLIISEGKGETDYDRTYTGKKRGNPISFTRGKGRKLFLKRCISLPPERDKKRPSKKGHRMGVIH